MGLMMRMFKGRDDVMILKEVFASGEDLDRVLRAGVDVCELVEFSRWLKGVVGRFRIGVYEGLGDLVLLVYVDRDFKDVENWRGFIERAYRFVGRFRSLRGRVFFVNLRLVERFPSVFTYAARVEKRLVVDVDEFERESEEMQEELWG